MMSDSLRTRRTGALTRLTATLGILLAQLATSATLAHAQEASPPTPEATPTYELRYRFTPGEVLQYHIGLIERSRVERGEVVDTNQTRSTTWNSFKVTEISQDGIAQLESVIERVEMDVQFDQNPPVIYRSWDEQEVPRQFKEVHHRVGKPISRFSVRPDGSLVELTPLYILPGKTAPAPKTSEPAENFFPVMPSQPVPVGHEWREDLDVPVVVSEKLSKPMKIQRHYTLKSVEGHIATITLKTRVLTPINDAELEAKMIRMTPSGTIQFDLTQGRLVQRENNLENVVVNGFGPGTKFKVGSHKVDRLLDEKTAQR